MGYRADNKEEQETKERILIGRDGKLNKIPWYKPYVNNVQRDLLGYSCTNNFLYDRISRVELLEKIDKILIAILRLQFYKIENACAELGCFYGMNALEDMLKMFCKNYEDAKWLLGEMKKWSDEFFHDCKWEGFDRELFSKEAELAMTEEAVAFRERRGFKWVWREGDMP